MKTLATIIVVLFFLGLLGKIADHDSEIKELNSRIEKLENINTNNNIEEFVLCGQYWRYCSGITNDPVELKEQTISNPLAVDDLIQ